jgi:uncharacterized coiled-coil protein SlyX
LPDDNLPQESEFSGTPENEPAQEPTREELEQARARVAELETLIAQKDEELAEADARIAELEQTMAATSNALAQVITSYKALVVKSNPGVPEELITGDTIEAINQSLEDAQTLITRVRQGLEAKMAVSKVPAGAPQRAPIDLSALSPREKIQYAIKGSP